LSTAIVATAEMAAATKSEFEDGRKDNNK